MNRPFASFVRPTGLHQNITAATNILLIDGMNVIHRAWNRFGPVKNGADLRNSKKYPTGHVYGVLKMLQGALKHCQPDCAAIIVMEGPDAHKPRLELFSEYKGQRSESKVSEYIPDVLQMLHVLPVTIAYAHEREADDMISFICKYNTGAPKIVVYSNDRDLWTLASQPNVFVLADHEWVDDDMVEKQFGVPITKVPLYKALYGDSSDNIPPAVPRLPTKYASTLAQFKDVKELVSIMSGTDEKGAKRLKMDFKWVQKLAKHKKSLRRNWKLVNPLPIQINEDVMDRGAPDRELARYLIQEVYECKSLYTFIDDMFTTKREDDE